jgi:hypothetical protein
MASQGRYSVEPALARLSGEVGNKGTTEGEEKMGLAPLFCFVSETPLLLKNSVIPAQAGIHTAMVRRTHYGFPPARE